VTLHRRVLGRRAERDVRDVDVLDARADVGRKPLRDLLGNDDAGAEPALEVLVELLVAIVAATIKA